MNCKCNKKMKLIVETRTLVGFFSPEGHNHDDNCIVRKFVCFDCKESYKESRVNVCSAEGCNWSGKKACECHGGMKIKKWSDDLTADEILIQDWGSEELWEKAHERMFRDGFAM